MLYRNVHWNCLAACQWLCCNLLEIFHIPRQVNSSWLFHGCNVHAVAWVWLPHRMDRSIMQNSWDLRKRSQDDNANQLHNLRKLCARMIERDLGCMIYNCSSWRKLFLACIILRGQILRASRQQLSRQLLSKETKRNIFGVNNMDVYGFVFQESFSKNELTRYSFVST